MSVLAFLVVLIWVYLLLGHGRFWQAGPVLPVAYPDRAPSVAVVVPARDEAPVIEATLRSLQAQDYRGPLRIIVVDDNSEDGTGRIARSVADPRTKVLNGAPRPAGWSGKLWAVSQGVAEAFDGKTSGGKTSGGKTSGGETSTGEVSGAEPSGSEPSGAELVLLTDADIVHAPAHVSSLVARIERDGLDMVSEMVRLNCASLAERALVPAFVFFFQLLYPFAWVNDGLKPTAAAAGGTIMIRDRALRRIGGIGCVRGALIDDVALAQAVKKGGRIWLGHADLARSVRPYPSVGDIWRMITRTAFVQLHYSLWLLAGTLVGMVLTWLLPAWLTLFGHGAAFWFGLASWLMLAGSYLPTLRRFGLSPLWAPFLPLVALFYTAATVGSAVNHYRGRGVSWKGRAYQGVAP